MPGRAGEVNSLAVAGATPGATVWFVGGPTEGTTPIPGCETSVDLGPGLRILGSDVADGSGAASVAFPVPAEAAGRTGYFQAVEQASCLVSNRVATNFP